jgi:very-short-patch-repair endonuclease
MADDATIVSIRQRLLKERHALLDLSSRNRLLNTPLRTRNNRAIEIVDEKASEVFRLLTSSKALTFLSGVQLSDEEKAELDPDDDITGGIPQPEDDPVDARGVASRHIDLRLQTRLTSEGLQKRLFDVWYDALTLEQEQGVNVLYLAIGLLKWFDSDSSDVARHAPLVLLPVKLERSSAADKFKLKWREEPPSPNLTLQAKMKAEFSLTIEDFTDEDEVDLAAYCAKVAATVANQKRWEVLPDAMVLGFFSFSKFLMYRDLDPENWPVEGNIDAHPLVSGLLRDGFPESAALVEDGATIDEAIPAIDLHHVVDADSSQTVAIAEAAGGRTLVVKGPPGTGKSQTITNIIAAAVARGKKVLFVAEKMAALDVVHRRLRQVGLGPLTLELHSNKVNKRTVLEELKRTRDAQHRPPRGDLSVIQKLGDTGGTLNAFAKRLHAPLQPSQLTPQAILGRLAKSHGVDLAAGYSLTGAETWNREAVAQRRSMATELAERHRAIGRVPDHVWRGVRRGPIDPVERAAIARRIDALTPLLATTAADAAVAIDLLGAPPCVTISDLAESLAILKVTPIPAGADRLALAAPEWTSPGPDMLKALVDAGRAYSAAWTSAAAAFNDAGQIADLSATRIAVVTKGTGLFRFLDGNYRAQIALLRSYLKEPAPKSQTERVALIDRMISAQTSKAKFEQASPIGVAFGAAWKAERSDWDVLERVLDWHSAHAGLPAETWRSLAQTTELDKVERARVALTANLRQLEDGVGALFSELALDLKRAFGVATVGAIAISDLSSRLVSWNADLEALSGFIVFAAVAQAFADLGGANLVDAIHDGVLEPDALLPAFESAYAEVLRVALFSAWPELRGFDGDTHNNTVTLFRQLDRARIELAQEQIVAAHAEGRPRGAAGIGPLGVLNAEMARKRGHLPIRVLLEKAGPAVQQLKPVFMMSPLSVAQFLKPGGLTFDLLVMDEASQIEPVDALGSVARASQLVVVGDERQLPPTAFFKKLTGEEDPEESDDGVTIQAKDAESILELCLAKGIPHRMLSWHYRSKHQSLIAVSNREFYENKLFIVPSPYDAVAGMGLKFNLLKNAPYDRGGTRTNPGEAKIIAEAVINHARQHPEHSLGVATFSVSQRQAVLKELELLRRANPDVEEFFGTTSAEPFFVKNLENIQGDERDVIFISVGYGKTEQGYLAHAFGPLSGEGGERRLNVLISRAKLRCEVFCNFTGADIDLERTKARGVVAMKLFLTFAETGHFGLGEVTGADFDSDFEVQVCERLQALGYDVKRQIGASGFRVDLAVSDPEKPGRFVLGIECDGAQFHSSRSARDRDRLRQQVLEAHGWIIHRVWSADWYLRPQQELKKIEAAIAAAKSVWHDRDEESLKPARAVPVFFEGERMGDTEVVTAVMETGAVFSHEPERTPYIEAAFAVNTRVEPHETPLAEMAAYVVQIVNVEGPIHLDEITARIRILWGLGRAGSRIRAAVERAAVVAAQRGLIVGGPFYTAPDKVVLVRDRSQVGSNTLRKPEMLPPSEIEEAMLRVVDDNFGAGRDDLVHAVSRLFGYAATSAVLRQVLLEGTDRLTAAGALVVKGDLLVREKSPT